LGTDVGADVGGWWYYHLTRGLLFIAIDYLKRIK